VHWPMCCWKSQPGTHHTGWKAARLLSLQFPTTSPSSFGRFLEAHWVHCVWHAPCVDAYTACAICTPHVPSTRAHHHLNLSCCCWHVVHFAQAGVCRGRSNAGAASTAAHGWTAAAAGGHAGYCRCCRSVWGDRQRENDTGERRLLTNQHSACLPERLDLTVSMCCQQHTQGRLFQ
jgi:hypothetical protein